MKASDIALSIIIIIIFIALYSFNLLATGIKKIRNNWPVYRCNPIVMPFAGTFGHDPVENFVFCIENMQTSFMGYLLEPIHYIFSIFGSLAGDLFKAIDFIRKFINQLRSFFAADVKKIFGVFLNILIEFQRIIIAIKDTMGKLIGVMVSILYIVSGSIMTMKSVWAGPPGQFVRALCFHPDTIVELKNGEKKYMKEINLGDILKNGSKVYATMDISNLDENRQMVEPLYEIISANNQKILVTGSHVIYTHRDNPIKVKNYSDATLSNITAHKLSCLITDDHKIPVDNLVFGDWEID